MENQFRKPWSELKNGQISLGALGFTEVKWTSMDYCELRFRCRSEQNVCE